MSLLHGLLSRCCAQASHCSSFSYCRALTLGHLGSIVMAPWLSHSVAVGSSQTRDRTRVSCVGRWILYHWATRDPPHPLVLMLLLFHCLSWSKHREQRVERVWETASHTLYWPFRTSSWERTSGSSCPMNQAYSTKSMATGRPLWTGWTRTPMLSGAPTIQVWALTEPPQVLCVCEVMATCFMFF